MVESNKTAADTYSLAIFRAIRRLQQAAEIHSKRLSRYGGLTPLQLLILHVLAVEGELTATQLAKLVSLSQASLSGVLDRLEGRGLLYRRATNRTGASPGCTSTRPATKPWRRRRRYCRST
ncbi:transcriptional regulator [Pseudomonas aeruginosa]|nr:transcriptional regulator [Pseudomonas aeruginosa]